MGFLERARQQAAIDPQGVRKQQFIAVCVLALVALFFIANVSERREADRVAEQAAATAQAASAAIAAITPAQYAQSFATFEKDVSDRLGYSKLLVGTGLGMVKLGSAFEQSRAFTETAEKLRFMLPLQVPQQLMHLPASKAIQDRLLLLLSIRARAMETGVEYVDTRKTSLMVDLLGKVERADEHHLGVEQALAAMKAALPR